MSNNENTENKDPNVAPQKIDDVEDIETKSPATRLLKRRREMFEKQQEYSDWKKDAEK